jgi:hypothetical protein
MVGSVRELIRGDLISHVGDPTTCSRVALNRVGRWVGVGYEIIDRFAPGVLIEFDLLTRRWIVLIYGAFYRIAPEALARRV